MANIFKHEMYINMCKKAYLPVILSANTQTFRPHLCGFDGYTGDVETDPCRVASTHRCKFPSSDDIVDLKYHKTMKAYS